MGQGNAKNIRVFAGWFGIDAKSKKAEAELASLLRLKFPSESVVWTDDNTSFWIEEKSIYVKHFCSNGSYFNYPIKVSEIPGKIDIIITRVERIRVEKIRGAEDRSQDNPGDFGYYSKLAKEDLKEHPVQEQGFDWDHVKNEIGNDFF
jgi:hypothetical protein